MAQQDNNKSANISDKDKSSEKASVEHGAKSGEDRATGEKTNAPNHGDKADASKQPAK